ncbi:hypothetical protein SRHO_G00197130 [Serrasalmus rhombeus]
MNGQDGRMNEQDEKKAQGGYCKTRSKILPPLFFSPRTQVTSAMHSPPLFRYHPVPRHPPSLAPPSPAAHIEPPLHLGSDPSGPQACAGQANRQTCFKV